MPKSTGDDWLGVPALAKELGVTMRTIYRILDTGELPSYKLGRVIRLKSRRRRLPRAGKGPAR